MLICCCVVCGSGKSFSSILSLFPWLQSRKICFWDEIYVFLSVKKKISLKNSHWPCVCSIYFFCCSQRLFIEFRRAAWHESNICATLRNFFIFPHSCSLIAPRSKQVWQCCAAAVLGGGQAMSWSREIRPKSASFSFFYWNKFQFDECRRHILTW